MTYMYTVGNVVRSYFAATGGLITFFAPINEAFDRIPEEVERRVLRDRIWLEQVLEFFESVQFFKDKILLVCRF